MAGALAFPARRRHRDRQHQLAVGKPNTIRCSIIARSSDAATPPRPRRARRHSRHSAAQALGEIARAPWNATHRRRPADRLRRASHRRTRRDPVDSCLDAGERLAAGIAGVRQRLPQRTPDARPGAGHGAHRQFVNDVAARSSPMRPSTSMPSERVGGKPDPAHHREQLLACADAGAAIAEVARGALEHAHVPAGLRSRWAANRPPTEPPITNARA